MSSVVSFTSMKSLFGAEPSKVMKDILEAIRNIAVSDLGVLIVGERGTEKEVIARRIHDLSARSAGKFVHVKCGAYADDPSGKKLFGYEDLTLTGIEVDRGVIEFASGGTIYFDQLTELPSAVQNRICQAVEEKHFQRVGGVEPIGMNVRFIASIDKRSGDAVAHESPRDPHCHLCPVHLNLPPLRERREDITMLIREYMLNARVTGHHRLSGISADALEMLSTYEWPGNTEELYRAMGHAISVCRNECITKNDLPAYLLHNAEKQTHWGAQELLLT